MNVRKVRPAAFAALVVACAVATGGCLADAAPGPAASGSPAPLGPRETLLKSLPDVSSGSFRFTAKDGGMSASGAFDGDRHSYRIDLRYREPEFGFTLHSDFLVVEEQTWIRMKFTDAEGLGLPKLPKKWMLIDPAKIKNKDDIPLGYAGETDPGEAGAVLRAIVEVRQTGAGEFAGTTDLTRQGDLEIVEPDRLAALGARARAVPFEATVDGQGRLTSAVVKIPAAGKFKASRYEVTYSDFGKAPAPAVPAADQQQKATEAAYELLNE
ncbi:hypothetical protein ACFQFC_17895 [Amorphoplanes digitatis]|uniref:Lipoprotein n=1 Tax=Actinoplanes digitatis TaxID=1868 RepID=A0A7W7MTA1_9ACTN|nr:hypothetical protein [Actinoplanes digitatis]MBB4766088.1 hypothetical protein [Actinoplanes digitatis]GID97939.1 hypothetical protein Adi01nite_73510 [Actinoplanes digitatis]